MPKNSSAVKRVQIALRNTQLNKNYRSAIKTMKKKIFADVETFSVNTQAVSKERLQMLASKAFSKIDKAVKKGVIHKNSAARSKSRIANRLKSI